MESIDLFVVSILFTIISELYTGTSIGVVVKVVSSFGLLLYVNVTLFIVVSLLTAASVT